MTTIKSALGKLNLADFLKGLLITLLTAFIGSLAVFTGNGGVPNWMQVKVMIVMSISGGLGYIVKQISTNSHGVLLKTEPTTPTQDNP